MKLPIEVIGLVAEHLAQHLARSSPFLESTDDADEETWQQQHLHLLNLVMSCRDVYHVTRHLLYTMLVLQGPADVVAALINILKYPQIARSIRHIQCRTELSSDSVLEEGEACWRSWHRADIALVESKLAEQGLRPPWLNESTDQVGADWERLGFKGNLRIALRGIFYTATEIESVSFHQFDIGWATLTNTLVPSDRTGLEKLRALRCHLLDRRDWLAFGECLFSGGYNNLRTLVLDGMSLMDMSAWSDTVKVENTRIENLYLGPRGKSKPPIPNARFKKQEWKHGRWLAGGPRLEDPQKELLRSDTEGWRPRSAAEVRRRMANLNGFHTLRLLDVVVDSQPSLPLKTLVALKNTAASLEVFRVEGYPFCVYVPDDGLYDNPYELAFRLP
ncbi:hypothetical protein FZEAL_3655 [Fusarium zealandicum]|uniref:Uncharacterized protein n=1 Tax=Fusarium zealandicum TaxID=1053134 RepID=A0A8H4XLK0_9HYPO|nr:hypothetical protein FZEAL_3655 [Fusarium zealandicum]